MTVLDLYSPLITLCREGHADKPLYVFDETDGSVTEVKQFKISRGVVALYIDKKFVEHKDKHNDKLKEAVMNMFKHKQKENKI